MAGQSNRRSELRLSIVDPTLYDSRVVNPNWTAERSPTTGTTSSHRRSNSRSSSVSSVLSASYETDLLAPAMVLFDFASEEHDPAALSIQAGEVVYVLTKQPAVGGWCPILLPGNDTVGWVPSQFLQAIEDTDSLYGDGQGSPRASYPETPQGWSHTNGHVDDANQEPLSAYQDALYSLQKHGINELPPSPMTPVPTLPRANQSYDSPPSTQTAPLNLRLNKPTPPTPPPAWSPAVHTSGYTSTSFNGNRAGHGRGRSDSAPPGSFTVPVPAPPTIVIPATGSSPGGEARARRRPGPMLVNDAQQLSRLSVLMEGSSPGPETPWYLRPSYTPDELRVDASGDVKAGTKRALVQRLVADSTRPTQEMQYRNAFLMTFRTFMKPDDVFDILRAEYEVDHPPALNDHEFEEWKEKRKRPVQQRVLIVLTMWLEDHRLLDEEHHIAGRLTEFLTLIVTPPSLALTAKLILQSLERLTFADVEPPIPAPNRRRRKSKSHNNDLLKYDSGTIAEHLCMLEHRLYAKINPQECLHYANVQKGPSVPTIGAFCATHDRLAQWVKLSIMNVDLLGRRADTVDFWIRVAEKCRTLNNFSSMAAVVNALSSQVISRLHLTWAHCSRKTTLETLLQHSAPTSNFIGYRTLQRDLDPAAASVPFVGMWLVDIVHIKDQFPDVMLPETNMLSEPSPISPQSVTEDSLICFSKRVRWYELISTMLHFQSRTYVFPESQSTKEYIEAQMRVATAKNDSHFWERSKSLQQSELHNADIRKGLGAAGF